MSQLSISVWVSSAQEDIWKNVEAPISFFFHSCFCLFISLFLWQCRCRCAARPQPNVPIRLGHVWPTQFNLPASKKIPALNTKPSVKLALQRCHPTQQWLPFQLVCNSSFRLACLCACICHAEDCCTFKLHRTAEH